MNKPLLSAALTTGILLAGAAAAQTDPPTTPAPPPTGMDAVSSGIGERAAKLRDDLRAAYERGAISRDDADAIGRGIDRVDAHMNGHVPRGFRERQRLRERLDALQAQLEKAIRHS
jgi:hypothetical protein